MFILLCSIDKPESIDYLLTIRIDLEKVRFYFLIISCSPFQLRLQRYPGVPFVVGMNKIDLIDDKGTIERLGKGWKNPANR